MIIQEDCNVFYNDCRIFYNPRGQFTRLVKPFTRCQNQVMSTAVHKSGLYVDLKGFERLERLYSLQDPCTVVSEYNHFIQII